MRQSSSPPPLLPQHSSFELSFYFLSLLLAVSRSRLLRFKSALLFVLSLPPLRVQSLRSGFYSDHSTEAVLQDPQRCHTYKSQVLPFVPIGHSLSKTHSSPWLLHCSPGFPFAHLPISSQCPLQGPSPAGVFQRSLSLLNHLTSS